MDTDKHGLALPSGSVTYQIVGCAMDVLNELGHGFHEKPYENAMVLALSGRCVSIQQQRIRGLK